MSDVSCRAWVHSSSDLEIIVADLGVTPRVVVVLVVVVGGGVGLSKNKDREAKASPINSVCTQSV